MISPTPTAKHIKDSVIGIDTCSVKNGVFTARRGFFYTSGRTAEKFVACILKSFPTAIILDKGEVWKPFRGGASTTAQSHWFVKFTFPGIDYRWSDDPRCVQVTR